MFLYIEISSAPVAVTKCGNLPPRKVIASLVYGYGAFVHEIRYKTWANEKSERIK